MQRDVTELRAEKTQLQAQVAAERLERLEREREAEDALADLESIEKKHEQTTGGLRSELRKLRRKNDDLENSIATLQTANADLKTQHEKELSVSQENANMVVVQANREAVETREAMDRLRREQDEGNREIWKKVVALTIGRDDSMQREAELRRGVEGLQIAVSGLQSDISSLNGSVTVMREEVETLQEQEAKLLKEIADLHEKNGKLRTEYAALCSRMSDIVSKNVALQSEVHGFRSGAGSSRPAVLGSNTVGGSTVAGSVSGSDTVNCIKIEE